jgi:peptidyl-tRNA hydrolase, PTH1 family
MKLIVGLGNPGKEYETTRHNAGFWLVDALAEAYGFPDFSKKFEGMFAKGSIGGEAYGLLKPQTYMNLSGKSVLGAVTFFKLKPQDILVVHDELDVATGLLKSKVGGGDAGHNGLKSITQAIGPNYARLRIGIGRPEHAGQVSDWVLKTPDAADAQKLGHALEWLVKNMPEMMENPVTALAKYTKPL